MLLGLLYSCVVQIMMIAFVDVFMGWAWDRKACGLDIMSSVDILSFIHTLLLSLIDILGLSSDVV